jgi:hypothetical protein
MKDENSKENYIISKNKKYNNKRNNRIIAYSDIKQYLKLQLFYENTRKMKNSYNNEESSYQNSHLTNHLKNNNLKNSLFGFNNDKFEDKKQSFKNKSKTIKITNNNKISNKMTFLNKSMENQNHIFTSFYKSQIENKDLGLC